MEFCHMGVLPFSQGNLKHKPHISFKRQATHLTVLHVQCRGESFQKYIHGLKTRISKKSDSSAEASKPAHAFGSRIILLFFPPSPCSPFPCSPRQFPACLLGWGVCRAHNELMMTAHPCRGRDTGLGRAGVAGSGCPEEPGTVLIPAVSCLPGGAATMEPAPRSQQQ